MKKEVSMKVLLTVSLLSVLIGPVYASTSGTTSVQQGITGGSLEVVGVPSVPSLSDVSLNGTNQTIYGNLTGTLDVADNTGNGNGWHVTAQASQFTEVLPNSSYGTNTLPLSSLALQGTLSVVATNGTVSPVPSITVTTPSAIDVSTPVKILSANTNQGMGSYSLSFPASNALSLVIPSNAVVDTTNYPSSATPKVGS